MASLGGQGAKGFAKGLTQGYGAVDSALTNKQNRDIKGFKQDRAEEIYALAKQKEEQIQGARTDIANQSATAINQETQEKLKEADVNQKASNANQMSAATNVVIGASTVEENDDAIANANTLIKNNPSLQKTMGMQPNDVIEKLDLSLPKDKTEFNRNLSGLGITPESMGYDLRDPEDKKTWENFQNEMQPLLSMVKVGDNYINAENMGNAMGSGSRASAKQNKQMTETQLKQQTTTEKAANVQADKNVATAKAKADKAGIYFDPSLLETVEEKNDAIDNINQKVQQSAFTDPMAGENTTQLDYKGGNEGLPTTQALVNGEMVDVAEDGTIVDDKGKPVVTENPNGDKMTQKQGDVKGTTETTTVAKDGTSTTTVTDDQNMLKPNGSKAVENVAVVEASVQTQVSRGKEVSDDYMRHLYALAGKTYPIPDDTSKMKNFKFMVENGATRPQAMTAIYGSSSKMKTKAQLQADWLTKNPNGTMDEFKTFTQALEGKDPTAEKMITADQMVADWMQKNPNATATQIKEYSAAIRAKYAPKGEEGVINGKDRRTRGYDFRAEHKLDDDKTIITDELIRKAEQAQISTDKQANTAKTAKKDIAGLSNAMTKMTKFRGMVENENYDRDMIETMKTKVTKLFDADFVGMTATEKKSHLDKVLAESYGGQILADYMKSISGTAIADAEYQRLQDIFSGGSWSDKESYIAAIEGFTQGIEDTVEQGAKDLYINDPVASLRMRQQVQKSRASRPKDGVPTYEKQGAQKPFTHNGTKAIYDNDGKLWVADGKGGWTTPKGGA